MYKRGNNIKTKNERKLERHPLRVAQPGDDGSNKDSRMRIANCKTIRQKNAKQQWSGQTREKCQQRNNNSKTTTSKPITKRWTQNTNGKRKRPSFLPDLENRWRVTRRTLAATEEVGRWSKQVGNGDGRRLRRWATNTGDGEWQWQSRLVKETGGSKV